MSSESGGHNQLSSVEPDQPYTVEEPDPPPLEPLSAGEKVPVVDNIQGERENGQVLEDEVH